MIPFFKNKAKASLYISVHLCECCLSFCSPRAWGHACVCLCVTGVLSHGTRDPRGDVAMFRQFVSGAQLVCSSCFEHCLNLLMLL